MVCEVVYEYSSAVFLIILGPSAPGQKPHLFKCESCRSLDPLRLSKCILHKICSLSDNRFRYAHLMSGKIYTTFLYFPFNSRIDVRITIKKITCCRRWLGRITRTQNTHSEGSSCRRQWEGMLCSYYRYR